MVSLASSTACVRASHCTVLDREGGTWRARPGSGSGRGGGKDGPSTLLALEKEDTQCAHTHSPLVLSLECDVR